ncbi:hypothetical protein V0M98_32675 (plasmid) [Pseudomonas silesiensis]|uniref:hypothetical protein n=1 Tax=Pseudomonas silesiensis TaxID=1853130 RepID=UPI0030CD7749
MLSYESIIEIYRSILEQHQGKVMRQFKTDSGGEVAVLVDGKIYWASVYSDGSVSKHLRRSCRDAWRNGGWYGEVPETQNAIDNPILLDAPNLDNHKQASILEIRDMVICPSGIVRRVWQIARHTDRICVMFTCGSELVYHPDDQVEFQDPFGLV